MNRTRAKAPHKILIAKLGLDGHDRGAKYLTQALRDRGFEVQYSGLHKTVEEVVGLVIKMEADLLGVSILSGSHLSLFNRLFQLIKKKELTDLVVVAGGIIPLEDQDPLRTLGVREIFGPGTSLQKISKSIDQLLPTRKIM